MSMKALQDQSMLDGGNIAYLEQEYERYLQDPSSVDASWRAYFEGFGSTANEALHSQVRARFAEMARNGTRLAETATVGGGASPPGQQGDGMKQIGVTQLINAYRVRGHQLAKIDPLGRNRKRNRAEVREVELQGHHLQEQDYDTHFLTPALYGFEGGSLREIVELLENTYCGSIGYEFMYVDNLAQKEWLQARIEPVQGHPQISPERQRELLERVTAAEGLERYLHTKYVGQKRFSLEGGEGLIVIMSELVRLAGEQRVRELVVGMAHRGRLNVLVNILGKSPADLFSEFEGKQLDESLSSGDVKYHQGFSSDVETEDGHSMHLTLAFNPSHLEVVSPVVEGSVRSRQDRHGDSQGSQVIPVVVHGDAAFAGQGVVMETFNMAESRGYSTKGTVHIIVNNQIGFTTSNLDDARSTEYCTDVAKMINAPIFHANGDDPEAVAFVTELAFAFRNTFQKDVVLDLVCYRRHGHNEADEPSATQPEMYKIIRALPTTRKIYADKLERIGTLPAGGGDAAASAFRNRLDAGECVAPGVVDNSKKPAGVTIDWRPFIGVTDWRTAADTNVPPSTIKALSDRLTTLPEDLVPHPRVAKIIEDRRKMAAGELPCDWGFGETMAYATLVKEGYRVRITGQDCGRGTFFHRHAVLHNQNGGDSHVPLRNVSPDQGNFLVIDSVLSELAVLGFEYGYASHDPESLVIWEAQFGDFANGAQMVIDQFISSGETKWGRLCGLTLLLPHGYEGQGPEHSSGRIERFLQLCAEDNMQIIVPSTPAQCFHMLRRQVLRPLRRPMIVFSPKSLLRHKSAVSSLEEFATGGFQPVLFDREVDPAKVERVVLCSGKVYYDLHAQRTSADINNVAIVRVEQLYPFPYDEVREALSLYPNAEKVLWTQEEPRNQGAWRATRHRVERVLQPNQTLSYVGRPPSASPAVGYASIHAAQQQKLVEQALGMQAYEFDH